MSIELSINQNSEALKNNIIQTTESIDNLIKNKSNNVFGDTLISLPNSQKATFRFLCVRFGEPVYSLILSNHGEFINYEKDFFMHTTEINILNIDENNQKKTEKFIISKNGLEAPGIENYESADIALKKIKQTLESIAN